jgi:hypothetical protein
LRCVALRCVALRCVALRCVAMHCVATGKLLYCPSQTIARRSVRVLVSSTTLTPLTTLSTLSPLPSPHHFIQLRHRPGVAHTGHAARGGHHRHHGAGARRAAVVLFTALTPTLTPLLTLSPSYPLNFFPHTLAPILTPSTLPPHPLTTSRIGQAGGGEMRLLWRAVQRQLRRDEGQVRGGQGRVS